jgi:hypothetical protein
MRRAPTPTCGREDLGEESVPLDHLATHRDAGYEGLEGGQRHRAARYVLAPPPERLVQFGGVNTMQPDQLLGDDDGAAVDDLGGTGEAIGRPAGCRNDDETPEHSDTSKNH